ncbi:hypothetical protein PCHDK_000549900, partial [Plasmodium chabaudi adami]
YNHIVNTIWDCADLQKLDHRFIHGNPVRIYTPNLILFEKFHADQVNPFSKKKFALGAKAHISDDITVILFPTRNLKYDYDFRGNIDLKEMLERAEPINDDADPEETLLNLNANVSGFVIRKIEGDKVDITYLNAIFNDGRSSDYIYDRRNGVFTTKNIVHMAYRGGDRQKGYPSIRSLTTL